MPLKSRVAGAARRKRGEIRRGGGSTDYEVKGKRATARQRAVIEGCLRQAQEDGASRRVMVAVIMTITQESRAGEEMGRTGNDDLGIFQQGRNWISAEGAKDPERATHAFLITGPSSWKKVHGGVKRAPGNLDAAIRKVQVSIGGYAQWEDEATRTVNAWLASDSNSEEGAEGRAKRYQFTRGEKGGTRENSWDAAQRLVEEVGAYRWAAGNVFYAVSGDELRAQAPSLTIRGDEGWLVRQPAWAWSANRAVGEIVITAVADHWAAMPGAIVQLHRRYGAMAGRWMVWTVSGARLGAHEITVVLRRPTRLRDEPPAERAADTQGDSASGRASLKSICQRISENRSEYLYGGGHGPPLTSLKANTRMDCSSSASLALHRAGFFKGRTAWVSGQFQSSYGQPGKGREFTVWANPGHMWIEGYDSNGDFAWRFDTSQHGGKSGPAFVTNPRNDHARFTARHWPGR